MKTIGLLGGMGWASTATYYRLLNEGALARLGPPHSAKVLLHSFDFAEIEAMQQDGAWERAAATLASAARGLERAGAELMLIGTNTMHKVAGEVAAAIGVPLLHVADAVATRALQLGARRLGLLGTRYTMEQDFYLDRLRERGLDPFVPEANDRELVHRIIFDELVNNVVTAASREALRGVAGRLAARGAAGVILGCTELELALGDDDASVPMLASTAIHVEAALEAALA